MKNKLFKSLFFFSVLLMIFIGGEALAASCKYPLPVFGTWPAQSMSNVSLFCAESSNILSTRYNSFNTNLGRTLVTSGWTYQMTGTPIINSTTYSNSNYPIRTYFVWQCADSDGSNPMLCNKTSIYSACGSSAGQSFASAPTSSLCTSGTIASSVKYATGMRIPVDSGSYAEYSNIYYWTCTNSGSTGDQTYCFARRINPINGQCGSADGGSFTTAPSTNLCLAGTPSSVTSNGSWYWTC
ncbi:MAG: hypothetical protein PHT67_02530, partial [Candidatus Pacebacteria bacterium]|nr:hypothetical protein [Candidatus Paceibacterota bacterium]